jgi:Sec-independent protein secretion pathway component TatC
MKTIAAILLIAIGAIFGYFMVLLLPVIFVTWLQSAAIETHEHSTDRIEHKETLSGWMHKQDDGSFTWTWYP